MLMMFIEEIEKKHNYICLRLIACSLIYAIDHGISKIDTTLLLYCLCAADMDGRTARVLVRANRKLDAGKVEFEGLANELGGFGGVEIACHGLEPSLRRVSR